MERLRQQSIEVIRSGQSAGGAYVASPTFSQYGYCWLRDGTWIAHAMDCVGQHDSAAAFHRWASRTILCYEDSIRALLHKVRHNLPPAERDYLPTRFTLGGEMGAEEWPNFQLDGYGAWLWGVAAHCGSHNTHLWAHVRPAIALVVQYLAALWCFPNYDCWEEHRNHVHPATLAALYGGLRAVQTRDATLIPHGLPEAIREFTLREGVSAAGHFVKYLGSDAVDASLLWLAVPYRLVELNDPRFLATVAKIERDLYRPGGGVYRYRADTYYGGGEWPLLAAWLAWVYAEHDHHTDKAHQLIRWIESQAAPDGALPEQVNSRMLDDRYYDSWVKRWGSPACPLLWSHAMYLIVHAILEAKSA